VRKSLLLALVVVLALGSAACGRIGGKNSKAGYAIGLSIGKSMTSIQDKIDVDQVAAGLKDQLAGKATQTEAETNMLLQGLQQGGAGDKAKTGYAVGLSIGRNVKPVAELIDAGSIVKGIKDQMAGKPGMDDNAMREALTDLGKRQQELQNKDRAGAAEKNKKEGDAYLAANKAKAGVKVTASGLQYEVIKEGKGPHPKATSTVKVHYVGTLLNGTEFDSSVKRGQPAEFPLNGVIPGWTEGVQLMTPGSKYKFTIPSALAYGANGAGQMIGPDAVLVFEVELLAIKKM
jgi:FKBP-type peptidyl-prolyl cis-trans isomerase